MIIHQPEIFIKDGEVIVSARVESARSQPFVPDTLWFRFPEFYSDWVTERGDGFLAALLPVAMCLGEPLECRGEVSPRLLYGTDEFQRILRYWRPNVFNLVEIKSERQRVAPAARINDQIASAFSGGVDSFFVLWQNQKQIITGSQLTHGLFIQGSPDIPLIYKDMYSELAARYTGLYDRLGKTLITAKTNLVQFSAHRIEYNMFLLPPLLGCAMILNPLLSKFIIPTATDYHHIVPDGTSPFINHLLRTESLEFLDCGTSHNRFDKLMELADWKEVQQNLRVCINGYHDDSQCNCGVCSKCLRTRVVLAVTGKLEKFATFSGDFTFKDYLRWGRWLEVGYGWEWSVLKYCWRVSKKNIFAVLVGISLGYIRYFLKKIFPEWIKRFIYKFSAPKEDHSLFAQS
ncbi:MAG: hypothetical protein LWX83_09315 [Anaerolineae bacterium]|nr:hypothetical protein [Anaerolineae bacterium]